MTTPTLPALSEEELDGIEELLDTGTAFTGRIMRSLISEVRRSRQPAGGTHVEMARAFVSALPSGCYYEQTLGDQIGIVSANLARLLEATERAAVEKAAKLADEIEQKQENDHGAANTGGAAEAAAAIRKAQP
jgi:hypothetical protein